MATAEARMGSSWLSGASWNDKKRGGQHRILPESPRWLMMKGKVKEAKEVLCYAAEVNKKTIPLNLLEELQLPGKKVTKASVLDFYSNRYLCKVTLVMGCVWLTISYSYFTLSLKLRDFGVSIHFRQAIPGILEVPARLCSIVLLEQMGRKWSLAVILIQTAFMCFLTLFLPQGIAHPARIGHLQLSCFLKTPLLAPILASQLGTQDLAFCRHSLPTLRRPSP
ncbi:hypothetical protein GHT09_014096 [Marmota monax]|uniref:Major facilitator superfamily (MFS) profile domain-containing protein n=1 Tax=Marmota monax TaxID=9995 RepID=A0A834UX23_MARMO|nr:hypothetical protein GHT09_014096 [Marmota monax]